ncbi:molybdate ABC transporter substrate-binding protein [Brevibacillus dissolubilis]|uniref:molybdate ABC transporter substrate-binding protein n=1 Tax=Brevibacillus dissolubilis TaxID=1844116 RepID=UPI00111623DF|nr:molybdate ABC transporter substrate-binding protein [Brevibacillus dissolubilis]
MGKMKWLIVMMAMLVLTACSGQGQSGVTEQTNQNQAGSGDAAKDQSTAGVDQATGETATQVQITVSAASSLQGALDQVKEQYTKEHPEVEIAFNYGSSGTLQKQIEQGAPADLFISAGQKQMDALEKKQLIDASTRRDLLANELVLIVPVKNADGQESPIHTFEDLNKAKLVAVGEPNSVPAGEYAKQVLTYYKLWQGLSEGKLSYGNNVRQVLVYVETGNVDAGLVYASDAKTSDKVKVAATAPADSHKPIVYPMAVVASTKNKEQVQGFADYLLTEGARQIFAEQGFKR